MRNKSVAFAALVSAVSLACVGCSSTQTAQEGAVNFNAEISEDTGRITLPLDRYMPSEAESEYLLATSQGAVAECALKDGVDIRGEKPSIAPSEDSIFVEFGPWRKFIAQKYGFLEPGSELQMRLSYGAEGTLLAPVSDEERAQRASGATLDSARVEEVRTKCASSGDAFAPGNLEQRGPWVDAAYQVRESLPEDKEVASILEELKQCYGAEGIEWDEQRPGYAKNVDYEHLRTEDIALAVKAAQCQEKLKATERIVKRWADLQKPIVEKYQDELAAQREKNDVLLKKAKEYVNTHPEAFLSR